MDIDVEQFNQIVGSFFPGLVGVHFTIINPGYAECLMEVHDQLLNPGGILHGGASYTLADTAMSMAFMADSDGEKNVATIEIKMSYMKPIFDGPLICKARMLQRGKSIGFLEADLTVDDTLVAKASGSFKLV